MGPRIVQGPVDEFSLAQTVAHQADVEVLPEDEVGGRRPELLALDDGPGSLPQPALHQVAFALREGVVGPGIRPPRTPGTVLRVELQIELLVIGERGAGVAGQMLPDAVGVGAFAGKCEGEGRLPHVPPGILRTAYYAPGPPVTIRVPFALPDGRSRARDHRKKMITHPAYRKRRA
jgi:hypothetical protein